MNINVLKQYKDIRLLETVWYGPTIYTVQQRQSNSMFDDVVNTTDRLDAFDQYKERFEDIVAEDGGHIGYDDLNEEMKDELRWAYLGEHPDKNSIDDITEQELEAEYGGISFVVEDSSCNL